MTTPPGRRGWRTVADEEEAPWAAKRRKAVDPDKLFERTAVLARALPEARVTRTGDHGTFFVADRKFCWFLNNHHGDGMICVCVKVERELKELLIGMDPEKYVRPAYVSRFGWLSIRVDHGAVDWDEIAERLTESYRIVAPKRLVKALPSKA